MSIAGNSIVGVMLFGIIIGDFEVMGRLSVLTMIPNIILLVFGIFESKNIRAEAHLCIEYMVVYRNTDCYFTDILFGGPDKDRSEII